eukprot:m.356524 g.356524  ORF g.356524 m.356524 type:complete len:1068 (-) comp17567_c0_seq1:423-3626(-)
MAISEEQAYALLDFSTPEVDVDVLDVLVQYFYNGDPGSQEQKLAEQILKQFQESEEAWTRTPQILEKSQNSLTKYFALNVIQPVVTRQWKVLPEEQSSGIKAFVEQLTIDISSDFETIAAEKPLLNKLDQVLVQIAKQMWPRHWPTFVTEIVNASKSSLSICQNNLEILKLLSEEIFDFSRGKMVQVKIQHLKDALCAEFDQIFELVMLVLQNVDVESLIHQTLQTLLRFLSWIPIGYVFDTELVPTLVERFLNTDQFRNVTLECLAEIASLSGKPGEQGTLLIQEKQLQLFQLVLTQLVDMLPPGTDLASAWMEAGDDDQTFIRNLALFFTAWLKQHSDLLESFGEHQAALNQALQYLVMMSTIPDKEVFKICLEYWQSLAGLLYQDHTTTHFMLGGEPSTRLEIYNPILSEVRSVMISSMAKPEEVLVVENDDGEVVREFQKDTDTIALYNSMRSTLVYLTHLDSRDTDRIMKAKLARQVDRSEYSWHNLNTLCWAMGSISGAMGEDEEKRFLVNVIKDLLNMCEHQQGKDHKAIIASNIMYIVGQYPRFLRAHWKFLKTVVNKLFEFMHEDHPGVQDMACDTFIKIAKKCGVQFVQKQMGEATPFIHNIIENLPITVNDLTRQQTHVFYEAVGIMIASCRDPNDASSLVFMALQLPTQEWQEVVSAGERGLSDPEGIRQLSHALKCHLSICKTVGAFYQPQLTNLYEDMLAVYGAASQQCQQAIAENGESVVNQPFVKQLKGVRRDILRIVSSWTAKASSKEEAVSTFMPPLFEAILSDYQSSTPQARESEVLNALASIIQSLGSQLGDGILEVFNAVFESTLDMITQDFETLPEFRTGFYDMLYAIMSRAFGSLSDLSGEQWKLLLNALVWGFKHPILSVADTALKTLEKIIDNLAVVSGSEAAQAFYSEFFLEILEHLLAVATDSVHLNSINHHSSILAKLFALVDQGIIQVPLSEGQQVSNIDFVKQYVGNLLKGAFPHLSDDQLLVIVEGFFALDTTPNDFKGHLRDFLVQCREQVGGDLEDLYLQERQEQLQAAAVDKRRRDRAVPGMLNPHDSGMDAQ